MGVYHGFEKNETAAMFFPKKPSLVLWIFLILQFTFNTLLAKSSSTCFIHVDFCVICKLFILTSLRTF